MNAATTSRFHSETSAASRQRSTRRRSMSSSRSSMRLGRLLIAVRNVERASDDTPRAIEAATLPRVGDIRFGPARVPSQESPEAALAALQDRGYTACEIDFEGRFWMDYDFAARFGELARETGIVLSVHAPIAGFMGHAERGK